MEKNNNLVALKILMIIGLMLMLVVNMLANILPIGGVNSGEVSDSYPNLFAPAPITFMIWFLIYVLLIIFILYTLGVFKGSNNELIGKIGIPFIFSCVFNAAWIFSWHYKIIWLSMILILAIFISLLVIYIRINKFKLECKEKWFVRLPFSIYFGWLTVATVGNVATMLVSFNLRGYGLSQPVWMIIIAIIAAIIGIATTLVKKDTFYGLVFIWAYAGILIKHLSSSGFNGEYMGVIITVCVALLLFVISSVIAAVRYWRKKA